MPQAEWKARVSMMRHHFDSLCVYTVFAEQKGKKSDGNWKTDEKVLGANMEGFNNVLEVLRRLWNPLNSFQHGIYHA